MRRVRLWVCCATRSFSRKRARNWRKGWLGSRRAGGARVAFAPNARECESVVSKLLNNPLVCELARE